jgi:hypothetical protein
LVNGFSNLYAMVKFGSFLVSLLGVWKDFSFLFGFEDE